MSPAIDMIRSRPIDAAHLEYQGLAKFIYLLVFDELGMFTTAANESFTTFFNTFIFPLGWRRL
jgi:hypothetical protein